MTSESAEVAGAGEQSPASSFEGIAILGSHPATVMMAPFDDPKWLIYACSPHNVEKRELPRCDEWFEVHVPVADSTRAYPYLRSLENLEKVWMRDKDAVHLFPGGKLIDEERLKNRFGPFHFTSSIAYIMAAAIEDCERLDIENIALFGIMQSHPNEYTYQRPGVQHMIWEACRPDRKKLGLKRLNVWAPDISKLFDPPPEDF